MFFFHGKRMRGFFFNIKQPHMVELQTSGFRPSVPKAQTLEPKRIPRTPNVFPSLARPSPFPLLFLFPVGRQPLLLRIVFFPGQELRIFSAGFCVCLSAFALLCFYSHYLCRFAVTGQKGAFLRSWLIEELSVFAVQNNRFTGAVLATLGDLSSLTA